MFLVNLITLNVELCFVIIASSANFHSDIFLQTPGNYEVVTGSLSGFSDIVQFEIFWHFYTTLPIASIK